MNVRNALLHEAETRSAGNQAQLTVEADALHANATGIAGFVTRPDQDGAAELPTQIFGTFELMATSNASPPFSIKHASSMRTIDGCCERILFGSLPGSATHLPPALNSSVSTACRSFGRNTGNACDESVSLGIHRNAARGIAQTAVHSA